MKNKINRFSGEYAFLSNFYPSTIIGEDGISYPTVEHYFQAMKTLDLAKRREIAAANTPGKAKSLGRHLYLRPDWESIKLDIMRFALEQKFSESGLRKKLLATGDKELIEGNDWHDNTYGNCYCFKCLTIEGKNYLGKMLMEIRDQLKELP